MERQILVMRAGASSEPNGACPVDGTARAGFARTSTSLQRASPCVFFLGGLVDATLRSHLHSPFLAQSSAAARALVRLRSCRVGPLRRLSARPMVRVAATRVRCGGAAGDIFRFRTWRARCASVGRCTRQRRHTARWALALGLGFGSARGGAGGGDHLGPGRGGEGSGGRRGGVLRAGYGTIGRLGPQAGVRRRYQGGGPRSKPSLRSCGGLATAMRRPRRAGEK